MATLANDGEYFRCLCVRSPYAGQIVDGEKPIEYRSTNTRIRGMIGIIESKSGTIIGEAELYDSAYNRREDRFYWHLRKARRYKKPVPYDHPNGAVIWVKLPMNKRGEK